MSFSLHVNVRIVIMQLEGNGELTEEHRVCEFVKFLTRNNTDVKCFYVWDTAAIAAAVFISFALNIVFSVDFSC